MIKKFFTGPVFLSIIFTLAISILGEFIPRPIEMILHAVVFFFLGLHFTRKNESQGRNTLLKLLVFPIIFTVFISIVEVQPKMYFHVASIAFIFVGAFCGYLFVKKEGYKWVGSGVGVIALAVACFYGINEASITKKWPFQDIPEQLGDFVLTNENGEQITNANLKDDVAILDFWNWSCKPCHKAMPELQKYYEMHPEEKVYSVYDPSGEIKTYEEAVSELRERGYTFPVLLSETETNVSTFGLHGFPTIIKVEEGKNVTFKGGKLKDLN